VNIKRRWPFLLLGLLISAGFLWFAFHDLQLHEIQAALRGANYRWLVPGILVYLTSIWFRSWRWGFLLRGCKRIPTSQLYSVVVIGYMGNNILPFRLGEVLRAYLLWRREQVNVGTTFTTALLERLFDGLTMVLFVLFGLLFVPMSAFLSQLVTVASIVFFGALVIFLLLASRPDLLRRIADLIIKTVTPEQLRAPLLNLIEGIVDGLATLRKGRDVLIVFGVTIWIWTLELIQYWLVSLAFDLHLPYPGLMLVEGAINLLTALPSLPGYIGTFEVGIKILEGIGAPSGTAGSYILVLHAIILIPVTLLGLAFVAREGIQWTDIWEAESEVANPAPESKTPHRKEERGQE
jgi:hypothetical protein